MRQIPVLQHTTLESRARAKKIGLGQLLLGTVSIGVGTLFAVNSVPSDVRIDGAAFSSALYLVIGILIPIVVRIRTDLTALLAVENALLLGIIYWLLLDILGSAYPLQFVTTANVQLAFGAVGTFALAIWIGASGSGWQLPSIVASTATKEINTDALFNATIIAFVFGMAKFVISSGFDFAVLIEGLGASRWDAAWARGDLGGADAFLDHTQYFGYILPSLCVLMANRVGWINWRVVIGLILSAIMIAFLAQSGGRRIVGVVVGAGLFTWVAATPRLGPTKIIGSTFTVVMLIIFMQQMLLYRNVGFAGLVDGGSFDLSFDHLDVDDNFLRLAQLTSFYPSQQAYIYFQPLYHALTLPIPRYFWPGKPLGTGFDLPALLGMSGLSLSTSIIGELYVSYGIMAVVVGGWVLGRFAGMWNKILQLPTGIGRPLMYGIGLMAMFTGIRSLQALIQMSYIVLAWIAISSLLPKNQSPRVPNGRGRT